MPHAACLRWAFARRRAPPSRSLRRTGACRAGRGGHKGHCREGGPEASAPRQQLARGCATPLVDHPGCATPAVDHPGCATPPVDEPGCATPPVDQQERVPLLTAAEDPPSNR
eukprot:354821-Chlamydomonas_euryale.AAC.2